MRRLTCTAALMFLLCACNASTQGDGFYRCTVNTNCPATAPLCVGGVCRDNPGDPPDAGSDMPDAGSVMVEYGECMPVARCGPSDQCILGAPETPGYCSPPCTSGATCPGTNGESVCLNGFCRPGCMLRAECPGGTDCTLGRWTEYDDPKRVCLSHADAYPSTRYFEPCAADETCAPPASCIGASCVRTCTGSDDCFANELCADGPDGLRACLPMCSTSDVTPCTFPGTTCRGGASPFVCTPDSWPIMT